MSEIKNQYQQFQLKQLFLQEHQKLGDLLLSDDIQQSAFYKEYENYQYDKNQYKGGGLSSNVYKFEDDQGEIMAIKEYKKGFMYDQSSNDQEILKIIEEIEISKMLNQVDSTYIVKFKGFGYIYNQLLNRIQFFMILEYCDMDLNKFLDECKKLTIPIILNFMNQMLEGLEVCQKFSVGHRDIKPDNILVAFNKGIKQDKVQIKLTDFSEGKIKNVNTDKKLKKEKKFKNYAETLEYFTGNKLFASPQKSRLLKIQSEGGDEEKVIENIHKGDLYSIVLVFLNISVKKGDFDYTDKKLELDQDPETYEGHDLGPRHKYLTELLQKAKQNLKELNEVKDPFEDLVIDKIIDMIKLGLTYKDQKRLDPSTYYKIFKEKLKEQLIISNKIAHDQVHQLIQENLKNNTGMNFPKNLSFSKNLSIFNPNDTQPKPAIKSKSQASTKETVAKKPVSSINDARTIKSNLENTIVNPDQIDITVHGLYEQQKEEEKYIKSEKGSFLENANLVSMKVQKKEQKKKFVRKVGLFYFLLWLIQIVFIYFSQEQQNIFLFINDLAQFGDKKMQELSENDFKNNNSWEFEYIFAVPIFVLLIEILIFCKQKFNNCTFIVFILQAIILISGAVIRWDFLNIAFNFEGYIKENIKEEYQQQVIDSIQNNYNFNYNQRIFLGLGVYIQFYFFFIVKSIIKLIIIIFK